MDSSQKKQLIIMIERQIGIKALFNDLGLINVTQNGGNVYCVCPFHEGADNPSGFCFDIKKQFVYCFTQCHKSYSLFDIVMKVKELSFIETVLYLADLVDMDINFNTVIERPDSKDNLNFLKQVKRAKEFSNETGFKNFDESILNEFDPYLHTVLRKEGFDNKARDYFNLGFCRSGYFENRITIPIDAIDGSIVTVSGRSVLPDIELEFMGLKKYLVCPNTDKSKTLYNISRANSYAKKHNEIIVVEGFKSVWRLHQWNIRNAVAVMGSALSDEQALLLLKLNVDIVVCGDNDTAGRKLNNEVLERLRKYVDVRVLNRYGNNTLEKASIAELTKKQFFAMSSSRYGTKTNS